MFRDDCSEIIFYIYDYNYNFSFFAKESEASKIADSIKEEIKNTFCLPYFLQFNYYAHTPKNIEVLNKFDAFNYSCEKIEEIENILLNQKKINERIK